jgi:Icc-related predicted phosphoesterase
MRLWVLSDLHVSSRVARTAAMFPDAVPSADIAVMAGDLCEGVEDAITFLARTITRTMPVVYTLGNHEYYGEYLEEARRTARAWARRTPNLYLLDDDEAIINGVRFVGSTLWTNYAIYSHGERARQTAAMGIAGRLLADHGQILMQPAQTGFIARNFSPRDALALHEQSVAFLDQALTRPHHGPTVVVTHHAPHPKSVSKRFADDPLTPAFVSDLSSLIDRHQPDVWIHGHTHQPFDYLVEPLEGTTTRVICNPRGYLSETPSFNFRLVIDV